MPRSIQIKKAHEHNLNHISVNIPRDSFVVITGLSGSGKSSLAFDTIYAEGQRRYLESLSAYARQFLEQMKKPKVESIDGLSPSISIEQKNISRNPRSTVGTVTEIYDYLRLLFSRIGKPHCYSCGKPIQSQSVQQIVDHILALPKGSKFSVMAPIVRGKKGEYQKELRDFCNKGFVRAKIDGKMVDLSTPVRLKKSLKHDISLYIDRLINRPGLQARLAEDVELAASLSKGLVEIELLESGEKFLYSTRFACTDCGTSFPELEPRSFSFNSPHGACPECSGLGSLDQFTVDKLIPDPSLSLNKGAIAPWRTKSSAWQDRVFGTLKTSLGIDPNRAFSKLSAAAKESLLYGSNKKLNFQVKKDNKNISFKQTFEGLIPMLDREWEEADEQTLYELENYISTQVCALCEGTRLKKDARFVYLNGKNISEIASMNIQAASAFLEKLDLSNQHKPIATPILKEISARLSFLDAVGLPYLTLSRSAATLSGGEAQRIRLATQIGSNLVGVLYILDEPSIGLHQRDNLRLIHTLQKLRDQGNSVLVVEHDEETIEAADFVVDLGPGAGEHGGELVFAGSPKQIARSTKSLTGQYLSSKKKIPVPSQRRNCQDISTLVIKQAETNNLKGINVRFPLGRFICVTGVSGSGKSSLIIDTLLPSLQNSLGRYKTPSKSDNFEGLEFLDKVIHVDQSPIGRTPRSNPATYTGIFSDIRSLFAGLPEAKMRGYKPARFSFNVPGGRCEPCRGDGTLRISMNFLPDVFVPCEICRAKRYNRETLRIHYRGKNIADVLAMTIEQAADFFERIPSLKTKLKTLIDVGLGYLQVGQSSVTLSGGEAQRIKLAKELNRKATGRTIYILDEPTTGLHFEDVRKLMQILHKLVDQGNTVVVIEHHLDVIKQADWIIDLGPEGGEQGGSVVFEGTPEELTSCKSSHTGKFLQKTLASSKKEKISRSREKSLDLS